MYSIDPYIPFNTSPSRPTEQWTRSRLMLQNQTQSRRLHPEFHANRRVHGGRLGSLQPQGALPIGQDQQAFLPHSQSNVQG